MFCARIFFLPPTRSIAGESVNGLWRRRNCGAEATGRRLLFPYHCRIVGRLNCCNAPLYTVYNYTVDHVSLQLW